MTSSQLDYDCKYFVVFNKQGSPKLQVYELLQERNLKGSYHSHYGFYIVLIIF